MKGEMIMGFDVAPICSTLSTPQDLKTIQSCANNTGSTTAPPIQLNTAPMCGYWTGPQDLGTIQSREQGLKKHEYNSFVPQALYFNDKYVEIGRKSIDSSGTTITINDESCFSQKGTNGQIGMCITQIEDGAELIQNNGGIIVKESKDQLRNFYFAEGGTFIPRKEGEERTTYKYGGTLLDPVPENRVFTPPAQ